MSDRLSPYAVAKLIREEHGNWTLSEIGRDGLADLIWEVHPTFQKWTKSEQDAFTAQVSEVIFGD